MKHVLFASAALLATLYIVNPTFAAEPTGPIGYVDADYGHTDAHAGGVSANGNEYGVSGSVTAPVSDRWAYKIDAGVSQDNFDHDNTTVGTGDIHALYRNNGWIFGGFAGGTRVLDETAWGGGLEAQRDFDKVSVSGTAGYGQVHSSDFKVWNAAGDVRFFPQDNVRLSAGAGWNRIEVPGAHIEGWNENVGGEYLFNRVPVSVFAEYQHADLNDLHVRTDAVKVGVRYTFGGVNLHQRDQAGADLNGFKNLFAGLNF